MSRIAPRLVALAFGTALAGSLIFPTQANAGSDPFIGELMLFGGNFCPRGWLNADGQLLPVSQNTALFSLYGTTYGGDGRTTFALPDLRGRAPIHVGNGPGLNRYSQGSKAGDESFTLNVNQMPSHDHIVNATNRTHNKSGPGGKFLAASANSITLPFIYHLGPPNVTMHPDMIGNTGGGQAVNKRSPYLTMRWCVATDGVFPSRN